MRDAVGATVPPSVTEVLVWAITILVLDQFHEARAYAYGQLCDVRIRISPKICAPYPPLFLVLRDSSKLMRM